MHLAVLELALLSCLTMKTVPRLFRANMDAAISRQFAKLVGTLKVKRLLRTLSLRLQTRTLAL